MPILVGKQLSEAVNRVLDGTDVRCAVAFWGRGAETRLVPSSNRTVRIICNLATGGTNPDVIERLIARRADVRHNSLLHAKVYIGDQTSIVTSANASINGLGLEGEEIANWIEAGAEISSESVVSWFEELWEASPPVSQRDLDKAREQFQERSANRPSRGSFADFHPTKEDYPFVTWVGQVDYDVNKRAVEKALGRPFDDKIADRIHLGIDIEGPEDVPLLKRGRWLLHWSPTNNREPSMRALPWWTCSSGELIPKGFRYKGKPWQDVMLQLDPMRPPPFTATERRFRLAFKRVMGSEQFSELRTDETTGSYFAPRLNLILAFWKALRIDYLENP